VLIDMYQRNDTISDPASIREQIARILIQKPTPEVCQLFASQLSNSHELVANEAIDHLEKIGPVSESYVWPVLAIGGVDGKQRACRALSLMGTELSLPYLEELLDDATLGTVAKKATDNIQTAGRVPVPVDEETTDDLEK
jgi:HEAT repeat protein